jgi:CPA2 family monovalent cation:H+ antiporter-2
MSELPDLYRLGANQVIPEEFETSIEIFSRVLREYGTSRNLIQREIEEIRREGYQMFRAPSLPLAEMNSLEEAFGSVSTETLFVDRHFFAAGKTLGELNLRGKTSASVTAAIREGATEINLGPDYRVAPEDILVLLGSPEAIDEAIEYLSGPVNGSNET